MDALDPAAFMAGPVAPDAPDPPRRVPYNAYRADVKVDMKYPLPPGLPAQDEERPLGRLLGVGADVSCYCCADPVYAGGARNATIPALCNHRAHAMCVLRRVQRAAVAGVMYVDVHVQCQCGVNYDRQAVTNIARELANSADPAVAELGRSVMALDNTHRPLHPTVVCRNVMAGRVCKYGDACKYSHVIPATPFNAAPPRGRVAAGAEQTAAFTDKNPALRLQEVPYDLTAKQFEVLRQVSPTVMYVPKGASQHAHAVHAITRRNCEDRLYDAVGRLQVDCLAIVDAEVHRMIYVRGRTHFFFSDSEWGRDKLAAFRSEYPAVKDDGQPVPVSKRGVDAPVSMCMCTPAECKHVPVRTALHLNLCELPASPGTNAAERYAQALAVYVAVFATTYNFREGYGTFWGEVTYKLTRVAPVKYEVTIDGDGEPFEWVAPAYHSYGGALRTRVIAGGTEHAAVSIVRVLGVNLSPSPPLEVIFGEGSGAVRGHSFKSTTVIAVEEKGDGKVVCVATRKLNDVVALTSMNVRDPGDAAATTRAITANINDRLRHNEYPLANAEAQMVSTILTPWLVSRTLVATATADARAADHSTQTAVAHASLGVPHWYNITTYVTHRYRTSPTLVRDVLGWVAIFVLAVFVSRALFTTPQSRGCRVIDGQEMCPPPKYFGLMTPVNATVIEEQFAALLGELSGNSTRNATDPQNSTATYVGSAYESVKSMLNTTLAQMSRVRDYGVSTAVYRPLMLVLRAIWRVLHSLSRDGPIAAAVVLASEAVHLVGKVSGVLANMIAALIPRDELDAAGAIPHAVTALTNLLA